MDKVLFKMTRKFQYIYDLNDLEKADDIYVRIIGNFKEIAKKQNGVINEYPVNSREGELCEKPGRKPIETKPRKAKINK